MEINFLALFTAALSTLFVGFIWYNPKVFGTIWMKESGTTEEKMKGSNMALIFATSFIYAFFISFVLRFLTIHQTGALGMVGGDASKALPSYGAFLADYGNAYRTFKHGALHGFLTGLFLILPVIGTNAMYEKRSFKYTLVTSGFWIVCFMIMGGIICAWE
jgi:predicted permease